MLLVVKIIIGLLFLLVTQTFKWNAESDGAVEDDIAKLYALFAGCVSIALTWNIFKSGLYMLLLYIIERIRYRGTDRGYKRSTLTHIILYFIELVWIVALMRF